MTPASLLADLRRRGVSVRADRGKVVLAPAALLTDELRAAIRTHKAALLALLPEEDSDPFGLGLDPEWVEFLVWADEWNHWEARHPRMTKAGKPRKARKKKRPVDALAVVRVGGLSVPAWSEEVKRKAIKKLIEEEEKAASSAG